jgi:signal transduction histidine kinase
VPVVLHAAFAVMVAVAVFAVATGGVAGSPAVLLAALAVWGLAYVVLGAPSIGARHRWRPTAFLAVHVGVVGVLAWQQPALLFLMFLAYPLVWFVVDSVRAGVVWTLALAVGATLGPTIGWTHGDEPLWGPGQTLVGMVLSLAMGLWVHHVLEQSRQRAELIAALESSRAELAEAHHLQGIVAERERLAREVHDTLAQGYTSIVVLAQTATAQLPADPGGAAERLGLIEEVARENLGEARAMVGAFAPLGLQSATLVEALQRLADRFGRETGVATRLDTSALGDGTPLPRSQEIVLLRGAQEALTNVRRHAAASAVVLRVSPVGARRGRRRRLRPGRDRRCRAGRTAGSGRAGGRGGGGGVHAGARHPGDGAGACVVSVSGTGVER